MNIDLHWTELYRNEIQQAENAKAAGNQGMSRVCARRAAGIIVSEYFSRQGIEFESPSVYERLAYLISLPSTNPQIKETAAHFLIRVTPDFELPIQADLISEANWLKNQLLNED